MVRLLRTTESLPTTQNGRQILIPRIPAIIASTRGETTVMLYNPVAGVTGLCLLAVPDTVTVGGAASWQYALKYSGR